MMLSDLYRIQLILKPEEYVKLINHARSARVHPGNRKDLNQFILYSLGISEIRPPQSYRGRCN